jgi:type IV pilus assembly protein PilA
MARSPNFRAGFTLIELLVVVAILGVLAAIAIPAFSTRQGKAYDARVVQDARNAATAEEAYIADNLMYFSGDCTLMPGVTLSPGVECEAIATGASRFQIRTSHPRSSRACVWASDSTPNLSCP